MKTNILITGLPKSGKSTILKNIISKITQKVGFLTNEILKDGQRIGFETETNTGEKSTIASIEFSTNYKVGKYFVNIEKLDKIINKIKLFAENDILFIDEIAEMQLFSNKFKEFTKKYFNSENICIATLSMVYEDNFIKEIKNRDDVIIVEISPENRESKKIFIEDLIKKINKAKRYIKDINKFSINGDKIYINTDHGTRNLKKIGNNRICSCDFFAKNNICSHIITIEEYLKLYPHIPHEEI